MLFGAKDVGERFPVVGYVESNDDGYAKKGFDGFHGVAILEIELALRE